MNWDGYGDSVWEPAGLFDGHVRPMDWQKDFEEEYGEFDPFDEPDCELCHGEGFIITCPDDMCRGAGECMHGDGEIPCPNGCGV